MFSYQLQISKYINSDTAVKSCKQLYHLNGITNVSNKLYHISTFKGIQNGINISKRNFTSNKYLENNIQSSKLRNNNSLIKETSYIVYTQQQQSNFGSLSNKTIIKGNTLLCINNNDNNYNKNIENNDLQKFIIDFNKKINRTIATTSTSTSTTSPLLKKNKFNSKFTLNNNKFISKNGKEIKRKGQNNSSKSTNNKLLSSPSSMNRQSETLVTSFEDNENGITDKLIKYYYGKRQIQTKYCSRHLRKSFVYIAPKTEKSLSQKSVVVDFTKNDKIAQVKASAVPLPINKNLNNNGSSSSINNNSLNNYLKSNNEIIDGKKMVYENTKGKEKELIVLLGWWNCHPKHLSKYVKLYRDMGHPVLAHISATSLMLVPKLLNKKNERLMEQLYQFWKKETTPQQKNNNKINTSRKPKIIFHTFSDNGSYVFAHFTYIMNRKLQQLKKKVEVQRELLTSIYQSHCNSNSSSNNSNSNFTQKNKASLNLNSIHSKSFSESTSQTLNKYTNNNNNNNNISINDTNELKTLISSSKKRSKTTKPKKTNISNSFTATATTTTSTLSLKKNKAASFAYSSTSSTPEFDKSLEEVIKNLEKAEKDLKDYQDFYYNMEATIMDSGPSLLTQSVITRGITAGITSMKWMRYLGIKYTHNSPALSKMIYYFYHWYVKRPSIAKYLIEVYYPAFRLVPKHMAYMFMYGNGDKVICPDLIEPYIYNLQKSGFLVRRAYFEGSGHVMHFVVHHDKYVCEVKKFIRDIREHSKIEEKSGVRVIYDKDTGRILDNEKILIPDKRHRNRSVWENAKANEEHFRFLGIMPNNLSKYE